MTRLKNQKMQQAVDLLSDDMDEQTELPGLWKSIRIA